MTRNFTTFAAALALEPAEYELDMFAGAQIVGGKVRAGTEILPRLRATNGHAVVSAALGVRDAKLRKNFLMAEIFELECLRPAELAPQPRLPHLHR